MYRGEPRRWNFEKFVTAHKQHHQILEGLMEHRYKGINERAKVRHLMAGIKDPTLTVGKSQILATPDIRNNFDRAVILYKDFITQSETHKNPDVQIAAVTLYTAANSNASSQNNNTAGIVEDWYYTKFEYKKYPQEQRDKLRLLHDKRGYKRKEALSNNCSSYGTHKSSNTNQANKQFKWQIASIVAEVLEQRNLVPEEISHQAPEGNGANTTSNWNHPALTRQSGNPKRG